jgi:hypothetical protein
LEVRILPCPPEKGVNIMSADLHIHVCKTEEEERHALLWQKKTVWSSEIGNAYTEYFYNGEWLHESEFLDLPEEEQDKFFASWDKFQDDNKDRTWRENAVTFFRHTPLKELDEELVEHTENIWIGAVSWLKASVFDDGEKYIPTTVMEISSACSEPNFQLKVIDDELIEIVSEAFDKENTTGYKLAKKKDVVKFFKKHKGRKCFQISW